MQPLLVQAILRFAPPAGMVPTGLSIADSALFLQSMHLFDTGFASLYATCQSSVGNQSLSFYAVPHLWLYGLLGLLARLLRADYLLVYAVANAVGVFVYLRAVHGFLRRAVPRHAGAAFLLFTLSAGPGGLLYLLTGLFGLHTTPGFESYFHRFAVYDLFEGPSLQPVLYFPRLYYTLSLACCFSGLSALLRSAETGTRRPAHWAMLPGSFVDARYALFTLGLAALYLWQKRDLALRDRVRMFLYFAAPAFLGMACASVLMRINPAVIENHLQVGNMAMWVSPFVVVAWLHLLLGIGPAGRVMGRFRGLARFITFGCAGYLMAQGLLYLAYQGYYGNLLLGRDGSVAAAISDPALLGALLGVVLAWRLPLRDETEQPSDWLVLWLLIFLSLSISGWGRGWFLQFGPQRLQVFLWLPLCVGAAKGIASLSKNWGRMAWMILIGCGVSGIAVATIAFQTPHGKTYAYCHSEAMNESDALLMKQIGPGTVMAPPPASDIIAMQRGNPVVFGIGSFNLTGQSYTALRADNEAFFDADTPDAERNAIAERWCVEWVYCPETWSCATAARTALQAAPWLETVGQTPDGQGLLLHVRAKATR
jgi:hypothetical protein